MHSSRQSIPTVMTNVTGGRGLPIQRHANAIAFSLLREITAAMHGKRSRMTPAKADGYVRASDVALRLRKRWPCISEWLAAQRSDIQFRSATVLRWLDYGDL